MNRIDRPATSSSYRGRIVLAATLAVAMTGLSTSALQAAILPRTVLKSYFQSGDKPTQSQFKDMIDSALNMTDDGLTVALPVDASGAVRFDEGALIGPVLSFADLSLVPGLSDDWLGNAGYLPLEINQAGQTHYGYLADALGSAGLDQPIRCDGGVLRLRRSARHAAGRDSRARAVDDRTIDRRRIWTVGNRASPSRVNWEKGLFPHPALHQLLDQHFHGFERFSAGRAFDFPRRWLGGQRLPADGDQ